MISCPVCDNTGSLLGELCPLCVGEDVEETQSLSELSTVDSATAPENEIGNYKGRVLCYCPRADQRGFGSIACDGVEGGIVSLSAKDIIGPEPKKCKAPRNNLPDGPAVSFGLRWKKGKPHAIHASLLDDADPTAPAETTETLSETLKIPDAPPVFNVPEAAPLSPATELHEDVERLRRLHGVSSGSFYTSPCANRIGAPEGAQCYFLLHDQGSNAEQPAGYIAYVERTLAFMKLRLVVDDPVCAVANLNAVLRAFIVDCDVAKVRPIFPCVRADVAAALRELNFATTMFGAEFALPLRAFEFSKDQRRYFRLASRYGLECRTICTDLDELTHLNESWLASKSHTNEMQLVTMPPSMPQESGSDAKKDEVRRIFAYQHGRLAGFMEAEPYYCNGKVVGYGLNSTRFLPNPKPCWIPELMFASLVELLKSEGRADHLAFGFSPCTELQPHVGEIKWLRRFFEAWWESGEDDMYSIHGLARKKAYYFGDRGVRCQDKFIALPRGNEFGALARFFSLLLGLDGWMKGLRKRWLWSWILSTLMEPIQTMPEIVRSSTLMESVQTMPQIVVFYVMHFFAALQWMSAQIMSLRARSASGKHVQLTLAPNPTGKHIGLSWALRL